MEFNPISQPLESLEAKADDNGTVPYLFALAASETLGVEFSFEDRYGERSAWEGVGIDVGEFVSWVRSLS